MDFKELPSQYDHEAAQKKWYPFWEQHGYFHADANDQRPPYTIVIPPPNVTGALHLGHQLAHLVHHPLAGLLAGVFLDPDQGKKSHCWYSLID